MNAFEARLNRDCSLDMYNQRLQTLQVNVGFKCNLQCQHCHLECGPQRTEVMEAAALRAVVRAAASLQPEKVDITGGAPELHPEIRSFIRDLRADGHPVQMRTNLTALLEPGKDDLPAFFRENRIHLVASLPCYMEDDVCRQRGKGTYEKSITALTALNALDYGRAPDLPLDLVYNPAGPFLPPSQIQLEETFKQELHERFGIRFNRLLTITNMPIGRFWEGLKKEAKDGEYMRILSEGFNCQTVPDLMCRHQICVAWNGALFDCDFNLALNLPLRPELPQHVADFDVARLTGRKIRTGNHCFGCTAGFGSSCGGALVTE